MPSVILSPIGGAGQQFLDNNGNPLVGGKLYSYIAGTTTPLQTYTDVTGVTLNTNPIILDSGGRCPQGVFLLYATSYKFVLKTSADVLIGTWDNITGIPSGWTQVAALPTASAGTVGQGYLILSNGVDVAHGFLGINKPDGSYDFQQLF